MREDGQFTVVLDLRSRLFANMGEVQEVLLTHGDSVTRVPEGFWTTSQSTAGLISSMEHHDRDVYGVQFHPEVGLTVGGLTILKNFLVKVRAWHGRKMCCCDSCYTLMTWCVCRLQSVKGYSHWRIE